MLQLYADSYGSRKDVSDVKAAQYESGASRYWELFYRRNADKFFKDRHYFDREFPQLLQGPATVFEVGCGVGNTAFPLLDLNPEIKVYACDFSPHAIGIVKAHPRYSSGRVTAFVADITCDDLSLHIPPGSCDFVTMVFVLSALSPEKMEQAMANVGRLLRPGTGKLLFRDYAEGDLAQERLDGGEGNNRLGHQFYIRGDGTRCYYFKEAELCALCTSVGFRMASCSVLEREIENKKRELTMQRKWLVAVAVWDPPTPTSIQRHLDRLTPTPTPTSSQSTPAVTAGVQADQQQQQQQQQQHVRSVCGDLSPSWLIGAAGRLASHLQLAPPGTPSGRATLPDSLDDAHSLAASLASDSRRTGTSARDGVALHGTSSSLEQQLERDFFATVQRSSEEVASEELATLESSGRSVAVLQLHDPLGLQRPVDRTHRVVSKDAEDDSHAAQNSTALSRMSNGGVPRKTHHPHSSSVVTRGGLQHWQVASPSEIAATEALAVSGLTGTQSPGIVHGNGLQQAGVRFAGVELHPGVCFRVLGNPAYQQASSSLLLDKSHEAPSVGNGGGGSASDPSWQPITTLAAALLRNTSTLICNKSILFLGTDSTTTVNTTTANRSSSSSSPSHLPSPSSTPAAAAVLAMAAVRAGARLAVASSGTSTGLQRLATLRQMNAPLIVVERLRLCTIAPGNETHRHDFRRHHAPGGVNTVCIVYDITTQEQQQQQLDSILVCAASLLLDDPLSRVWLLVLCSQQQIQLSASDVVQTSLDLSRTETATAMLAEGASSSPVQKLVHKSATAAGFTESPLCQFWGDCDIHKQLGLVGGLFFEFSKNCM